MRSMSTNHDRDGQQLFCGNQYLAPRGSSADRLLDRAMERAEANAMRGSHCGRSRPLWSGHGLLASTTAGVVRGYEISAYHPSDHVWERALKRNAGPVARPEYQPATVLSCD